MKHIKSWNRECFNFLKDNKTILLFYIIIIPLILLVYVQNYLFTYTERGGISFCFADYFIFTQDTLFFYIPIVIFSNLLCVFLNRHDFRINHVIRQKSLSMVWIKQGYFSFLVALVLSLYQLIVNAVIASVNDTVPINFHEQRSLFGLTNYGVTLNGASTAKVIFFASLFCFFMLFFINLLYTFIKWIVNHDIICFIAVLVVGYADSAGIGICSIAGINYTNWLPYRSVSLLIPILGAVVIFIIGLQFSKHKELFHAN